MRPDKQMTFCTDLDIGALGDGATGLATDVYDMAVAGRGNGEDSLSVIAQVTEAFATLTSLNLKVETDSATDFATANEVIASKDIATAALTVGSEHFLGRLEGTLLRYAGVRYTCTGNPSAGKITIFCVKDRQTNT